MDQQEKEYLKGLIEAILFLHSEPINYSKLSQMLEKDVKIIKEIVKTLESEYINRKAGIKIQEIDGRVTLATNEIYSQDLKNIFKHLNKKKLSEAALLTLIIIAYLQPITKAEIEDIRGVSCDGVIKDLMDKKLIKIVGRKDTWGRPALYGTTDEFLKCFGLKSIKELPNREEIKEPKFE